MKRKRIENSLKERIAKSMFFALTAMLTYVSYLIELRPQIITTMGFYCCGIIDGVLITVTLVAGILYFDHKFYFLSKT